MSTNSLKQAYRRTGWVDRLLFFACVLLFAFSVFALAVMVICQPAGWGIHAATFAMCAGAAILNSLAIWERVK